MSKLVISIGSIMMNLSLLKIYFKSSFILLSLKAIPELGAAARPPSAAKPVARVRPGVALRHRLRSKRNRSRRARPLSQVKLSRHLRANNPPRHNHLLRAPSKRPFRGISRPRINLGTIPI